MNKRLTLIGLSIIVAASISVHAQTANSPSGVANSFYKKYVAYQMRGLPTTIQMKSLAPLFSQEILNMIAADRVQQTKFIKEHPGEKPPWIEGDLFSSLFEGATSYSLGKPGVEKGRAVIDVHLIYKYKSDATEWTDTIALTQVKGKWVISDILFKGNWAYMNGASLRASLTN
jgi:hypothetical protein